MFLMPRIYFSGRNDLEMNMSEAFNFVYEDTLEVYKKHWLEEDFRGESYLVYKAMQYHLALMLVMLFYIEWMEGFSSYETLLQKYRIKCNIEELACNGVKLKKLMEIYGIPVDKKTSGEGVDFVQIERNHIVEGVTGSWKVRYKEDICELLKCTGMKCTNHITDCITKNYTVLNADTEGLTTEKCNQYLLI